MLKNDFYDDMQSREASDFKSSEHMISNLSVALEPHRPLRIEFEIIDEYLKNRKRKHHTIMNGSSY